MSKVAGAGARDFGGGAARAMPGEWAQPTLAGDRRRCRLGRAGPPSPGAGAETRGPGGGCELPPGKLSRLRGQRGPKRTAMALGSRPRPARKEGGVGKVLPSPGKKTTLWAQPLTLPLQKGRGGDGGSQQISVEPPSAEMNGQLYCAGGGGSGPALGDGARLVLWRRPGRL